MKKIGSILLVITLMLAVFAGCGSAQSATEPLPEGETASEPSSSTNEETAESENSPAATSEIDFEEEPYPLVVCYPVMSEAQPDLPLIEEAISKAALEKINATVEFEAVGLFSMANIYALKASSQEKMDLMALMPGSRYLPNFANSHMIQPLDEDLQQWGGEIQAVLGETLKAGQYGNEQLAIPQNDRLLGTARGFNLSVPLCEKHGIVIDDIKTLEDLEAVFALIHEKEPDIIVLAPEQSGGAISHSLIGYPDTLGLNNTMLQVEENGALTVVNQLESEVYLQAYGKVREWYEKGYISRDVTTTQDSGKEMVNAGKAFAVAAPSISPALGDNIGTPKQSVVFNRNLIRSTTDDQLILWAVPTASQRPDKAIQFLNMMMIEVDLANTFHQGIEGTHYQLLDNGMVEALNTDWQNNWELLGDANKKYFRAADVLSIREDITVDEYLGMIEEWNKNITLSPAYGFTFDPAPVQTEVAACDAVNDEYLRAIGNGTVDPNTEVEKYNQKLKDSGLDTIIEEIQRQLDQWVGQ